MQSRLGSGRSNHAGGSFTHIQSKNTLIGSGNTYPVTLYNADFNN
jgi:hypothetical protein